MVLLNSATLETTKLVPSSVHVINWADFGSIIILRAGRSESTTTISKGNSILVELSDEVIGGDRFSTERARLGHGLQRVFFATTVAPTISRTSRDGVTVRNVHLVVNGTIWGMNVHISSLV